MKVRGEGMRCPFVLHVFSSYGDFFNPDPLTYRALKNAHKFQGHRCDLWETSTFQKQAPSKGSFSIWPLCVFTQGWDSTNRQVSIAEELSQQICQSECMVPHHSAFICPLNKATFATCIPKEIKERKTKQGNWIGPIWWHFSPGVLSLNIISSPCLWDFSINFL